MLAVSSVACGGSVTDSNAPDSGDNTPPGTLKPPPPAAVDAGPPAAPDAGPVTPPVDHGQPSSTYPAYVPDIGQLSNNGGVVLASAEIVTLSWPNEPNADAFEKFGDEVGQSAYWTTVTSEYGVGPATSGPTHHVRMTTAAPASMSDSDIATFVTTNATNLTTSKWPAPTASTIYIMYMPTGTQVLLGGSDACSQGVGGYHDSVSVNGLDVAYAVVLQCGNHGSAVDDATLTASHELGEAVTDPHPSTKPAWVGFDNGHLGWDLFQQFMSENGDACEFYRDSFYKETGTFSFAVQRQWSNKSAAGGHSPCVPQAPGPYFNVTPLKMVDVSVDLTSFGAGPNFKTKGYRILKGETKTFAVGFYSDAPTNGPWTIKAYEDNPILGAPTNAHLAISLDTNQGENGNIAYVTVTVNSIGSTRSELVSIGSRIGSAPSHFMPIVIGSE